MTTPEGTVLLDLIRCGETAWDQDGRLRGSTDLPLSEIGRSSIGDEVTRLPAVKASIVHHPPDEAATETASIVADHVGAKTRAIDELADPDLGLLEGLTEQEFAERFPKRQKQWHADPLSIIPPEGEPIIAAQSRLFRAITKIIRKSKESESVVVLHPLGLGLCRCRLARRPATCLWDVLESRPSVERYVLTPTLVDDLETAAQTEVPSA